ncbi:ferredoxin [Streptomyces sp. WAC05374]|nr:ferredoxin [Streptomyces sp. WAC05374]RST16481.1 ferredoxin [Streptomyces sp. WAC05374]TDF54673.1 ferredoxin [Streptomyces sp. WAC05374]TDF56309.1 ferredoxin [Streptomyces sp. WAC05374]
MTEVSWTTEVDQRLCMASGMCAALAPELYRLDGAHAEPVRKEIDEDDLALDVADSCPALAIVVRDGSEVLGPRP